MVTIGTVDNVGPNNLKALLRRQLRVSRMVDIAVAFVTEAGLIEILGPLKRAAKSGSIRFLTGLYQWFTEPAALRMLLSEQQAMPSQFSVRLSRDPHFHCKLYLLTGRNSAMVSVGSSNLTLDGLLATGELNLVASARRTSNEFLAVQRVFDRNWNSGVPLNAGCIDMYERDRVKLPRRELPRVPLTRILGASTSGPPNKTDRSAGNGSRQFWRDFIGGYVGKQTEHVIGECTNWDEKGYTWYTSRQSRHRRGDRLVMFDLADARVTIAEVVDWTATPKRTPDGKYFTAFVKLRGTSERKITNRLWRQLRQDGVLQSRADAMRPRKLTEPQWKQLVSALERR